MFKSILLSVALSIIVGPVSVYAQQVQNTDSSLQNQPPNTQSTNNPIVGNDGTKALTEAPPDSLGVIGNPSQESPSVSVGPSNSKTGEVSADSTSSNSGVYGFFIIFALVMAVIYIVIKRQGPTAIAAAKASKNITPPKAKSVVAETTVKKTKKKASPAAKKKKKKRTHR